MTVAFTPVQWNRNKLIYDLVLVVFVAVYVLTYIELAPAFADHSRPPDVAIIRMRAFGSCAFLMLSFLLCIGPLAVLDKRWMPLLYNRRHFGVLTFFVALSHARFVLDWYFAFSPTPKLEALLSANTAIAVVGFPFEWFGIAALLVLGVMAFTSHDFWLAFLGPRLWKSLHVMIYPAYAALVAHVAFGPMMDDRNPLFPLVVCACAAFVSALHIAAAREEKRALDVAAADEWVPVGRLDEFEDKRGRTITLANGERAAVFRSGTKLAALSNACAHQNGPLGEGRVTGDCVTCPWHGYEYRLEDGCSPAPFTEKVPTYELRIDGDMVMLRTRANPPGTAVALVDFDARRSDVADGDPARNNA